MRWKVLCKYVCFEASTSLLRTCAFLRFVSSFGFSVSFPSSSLLSYESHARMASLSSRSPTHSHSFPSISTQSNSFFPFNAFKPSWKQASSHWASRPSRT